MQWSDSSYLWNPRLWWSCLQGTMGMWQGSGSGSVLGFSERNLLWCALPSPSLIVNSFFLSQWLQTQLVSTSQIRSDHCIWYVGVICKTHMYERRRWVGREREREREKSLLANVWGTSTVKGQYVGNQMVWNMSDLIFPFILYLHIFKKR